MLFLPAETVICARLNVQEYLKKTVVVQSISCKYKQKRLYLQEIRNFFFMPTPQVKLDLMEFIEQNILPKYTEFGASHGLKHVMRVIANSLDLARITGVDANMAYTVAAYHDIGMSGPRAIHHITGGKILAQDARLKRWFSSEQIRMMREAVEDHRASTSHQPRNIYGKIVAEADRDLDLEEVFRRAVEYGLEQYPEKTAEEQWQRFRKHMNEKYSVNGYIRLWIPNSPNEKKLRQLREVIADDKKLKVAFDRLYRQEKGE
ncbi:HD domain protein [Hoylesella oralis ATCC 33269]|uniref:HD domain protein n=2 Tax=Hoylesella oralis TaxID=28134 RepID=E7RT47_9BACT|nr:HD domain protein [Hoylesella oralis ATCC 33269]